MYRSFLDPKKIDLLRGGFLTRLRLQRTSSAPTSFATWIGGSGDLFVYRRPWPSDFCQL